MISRRDDEIVSEKDTLRRRNEEIIYFLTSL